jgi:hypothetical protein
VERVVDSESAVVPPSPSSTTFRPGANADEVESTEANELDPDVDSRLDTEVGGIEANVLDDDARELVVVPRIGPRIGPIVEPRSMDKSIPVTLDNVELVEDR